MDAKQMAAREHRAQRRRTWSIRKLRLGEEPSDNLSLTTTAKERLEMMWPLALEAWSLTGRAIPDYNRKNAPIKRLLNARTG